MSYAVTSAPAALSAPPSPSGGAGRWFAGNKSSRLSVLFTIASETLSPASTREEVMTLMLCTDCE